MLELLDELDEELELLEELELDELELDDELELLEEVELEELELDDELALEAELELDDEEELLLEEGSPASASVTSKLKISWLSPLPMVPAS